MVCKQNDDCNLSFLLSNFSKTQGDDSYLWSMPPEILTMCRVLWPTWSLRPHKLTFFSRLWPLGSAPSLETLSFCVSQCGDIISSHKEQCHLHMKCFSLQPSQSHILIVPFYVDPIIVYLHVSAFPISLWASQEWRNAPFTHTSLSPASVHDKTQQKADPSQGNLVLILFSVYLHSLYLVIMTTEFPRLWYKSRRSENPIIFIQWNNSPTCQSIPGT